MSRHKFDLGKMKTGKLETRVMIMMKWRNNLVKWDHTNDEN